MKNETTKLKVIESEYELFNFKFLFCFFIQCVKKILHIKLTSPIMYWILLFFIFKITYNSLKKTTI